MAVRIFVVTNGNNDLIGAFTTDQRAREWIVADIVREHEEEIERGDEDPDDDWDAPTTVNCLDWDYYIDEVVFEPPPGWRDGDD